MDSFTSIGQDLEIQLGRALGSFQLCEPSFQVSLFKRLKSQLTEKIDQLAMTAERRSYFLHQLNNVHELEELMDLVREINILQLKADLQQENLDYHEVIFPLINDEGISWSTRIYPTIFIH